jgi:hypothetical protein
MFVMPEAQTTSREPTLMIVLDCIQGLAQDFIPISGGCMLRLSVLTIKRVGKRGPTGLEARMNWNSCPLDI